MKRVSSKYIINSLQSEFGFKNLNTSDVFDYIGDAVQLIGGGLHQDILYKQAKIDFYKIHYPCEVNEVLNVYYEGKIVSRKHCKVNSASRSFGWIENQITDDVRLLQLRDRITALEDQSQDELEDREKLLGDIIKSFDFVHKYKKVQIDNNKWVNFRENIIETNIEEGVVYLEYLSIAVDEEGLPILHDEIKYLNAIKYYCTFILIQSGVKHPVISYGDALSLKDIWIARAKNENRKLDTVTAHNFKSNWTNILKGSSGKYRYSN